MTQAGTEDKRREILEASARVIASRGLCETRISDVAEMIGVSPALIIYYFDTKDALLAATLAHQEAEFGAGLAAILDGPDTARTKLREMIRYSCPSGSEHETSDSQWRLWFDLWSRARHDRSLAAERARLDSGLRDSVAGLVRRGIREGEFVTVDPDQFALELTSLIDGLAIQVLLDDPQVTASVMVETLLGFAERNLLPH